MPGPPRKTITKENAPFVYRYLLTALTSPKRGMFFVIGPEQRTKALRALRRLSPDADQFMQGSDVLAPEPGKLQAWCDKTLEGNAIDRAWTAFRQYEYKARHKVRRIGIKEKLYYRLSSYADHEGLTIEGALDKLLNNVTY